MKRKGFTLMELLLVVAILAIVAAAAAPTFTSGASDALKEARKSGFLSAYQNTVTGAHMMIALGASKGYDATNINLDSTAIITPIATLTLDYYAPIATRQFKNNKGNAYTLGARVTEDHKLVIVYKQGLAAPTASPIDINMESSTKDSSKILDEVWNSIADAAAE